MLDRSLHVFVPTALLSLAFGNINDVSRKKLFHQLTDSAHYDSFTSPSQGSGNRTQVQMSIFVEDLSAVRAGSSDYKLDFYLRLSWQDQRLKYEPAFAIEGQGFIQTFNVEVIKNIWTPDMYIGNSKTAHYIYVTVPNILLRIYPDGSVFMTQRIKASLICMLELKKFPLDQQKCSMLLYTWSTTTEMVNVRWKFNESDSNLAIADRIKLPDFEISSKIATHCDGTYSTGVYSCLEATFHLQRFIAYHIFQLYIPSGTVVLISWISFWMSPKAVPARATLSITTFLALSTQATGIRSTLPPVSYVTAVDAWFTMCTIFIFAVLIEFAVAYNLHEGVEGREKKIEEVKAFTKDNKLKQRHRKMAEGFQRVILSRDWLDKLCRYIFPLAFLISNLVYWISYDAHKLL